MKDAQPAPKLNGVVEMDETYVGGKKKGLGVKGRRRQRKSSSASNSATGNFAFFHAEDAKWGTLADDLKRT